MIIILMTIVNSWTCDCVGPNRSAELSGQISPFLPSCAGPNQHAKHAMMEPNPPPSDVQAPQPPAVPKQPVEVAREPTPSAQAGPTTELPATHESAATPELAMSLT